VGPLPRFPRLDQCAGQVFCNPQSIAVDPNGAPVWVLDNPAMVARTAQWSPGVALDPDFYNVRKVVTIFANSARDSTVFFGNLVEIAVAQDQDQSLSFWMQTVDLLASEAPGLVIDPFRDFLFDSVACIFQQIS